MRRSPASRDRSPAAPESRSRAVGPRRHPHRPRRRRRGRRVPAARGLLPPGQRPHLRRHARPVRASRADRHRHRRRGRSSAATSSRRSVDAPTCPASATRRRPPSTPRSTPGSSSARRSCATSSAPPAGSPASATRIRRRSRRPSTAPRRSCSPSARSASTPASVAAQGAAPRRLRPARLPARPSRRDLRRTHRLHRPRRADDRAPAERPRRRRRPAIGRQDELRAEHRRARRGPRSARRVGVFSLEMSKEQLVLRMLSSVANIDSQRLRTGLPRGAGLRPHRAGDELAVGSPDVHRRHAEHLRDGAAHEGPATAGRGRPGPRRSSTTSS